MLEQDSRTNGHILSDMIGFNEFQLSLEIKTKWCHEIPKTLGQLGVLLGA